MVFEGDVNTGQAPPQIGVWVTLGDAGDTKGHRKQIWPSFLEPRLNEAECKHLHDFFKDKIWYFQELSGMPYSVSSHASSWAGAVNSALPVGSGVKEEPRPGGCAPAGHRFPGLSQQPPPFQHRDLRKPSGHSPSSRRKYLQHLPLAYGVKPMFL